MSASVSVEGWFLFVVLLVLAAVWVAAIVSLLFPPRRAGDVPDRVRAWTEGS